MKVHVMIAITWDCKCNIGVCGGHRRFEEDEEDERRWGWGWSRKGARRTHPTTGSSVGVDSGLGAGGGA